MGKETEIAWTDHTWNPWQGCRKVSLGCLNCYMFRDKKRFGQDPEKIVKSKSATFKAPLKWRDPARVFVCSWSDFFIDDADKWRDDAWDIIRRTSHLTYQILTKRPENIKGMLPDDWPLPNVWLGVTAENQDELDRRAPILCSIPATIRFVSIEPMLGMIDIRRYLPKIFDDWSSYEKKSETIDWVIVGGETGENARLMDYRWAVKIMFDCFSSGIPFFMKQMTNRTPIPINLQRREFP